MTESGNPSDRPRTQVRVTISIAPMSATDHRVVDLFGSLAFDIARLVGCSRRTSSNANVQTIEQTSEAIESNLLSAGAMKFEMQLEDEDVQIRCDIEGDAETNAGTEAWFRLDEPERPAVNPAAKTMRRKRTDLLGPKEKLAETVRERRVDRAQGGLGLMRMKSETRKRSGGPRGGGDGSTDGGSPAPATAVIPLPKKP